MLIYLTTNYIDENSVFETLSEHDLYVVENIYNERPSFPYRTEGVGAAGAPEYICVDLITQKDVTFCGIFNHNFTDLSAVNDSLLLKGCNTACDTCNWAAPPASTTDLTLMACAGTQPIDDFSNLYSLIDYPPGHRYWRLEIIDTTNTDGYIEIGDFVLGQWQYFQRGSLTMADNWVHLQPGRADGPMFYMGNQKTHYGQDWTNYYSEAEHFSLVFKNINDPCIVDEIQVFLKTVQSNGGKFVIVPDDTKPFCYYVVIENLKDYAQRLMYAQSCDTTRRQKELREWRIELKTLCRGAILR